MTDKACYMTSIDFSRMRFFSLRGERDVMCVDFNCDFVYFLGVFSIEFHLVARGENVNSLIWLETIFRAHTTYMNTHT